MVIIEFLATMAVMITICHQKTKKKVHCNFLLPRLESCCYKLVAWIEGLWRKSCIHENKSCCYRVRVYCNNCLLPRKGMRHETSVVGIGCRNKCLSPQTANCHGFDACCIMQSPRTNLWHQTRAATRKICGNLSHRRCNSTLSCHILFFVAITYYHASYRNAWQRTSCRCNRRLLPQFVTYCHE